MCRCSSRRFRDEVTDFSRRCRCCQTAASPKRRASPWRRRQRRWPRKRFRFRPRLRECGANATERCSADWRSPQPMPRITDSTQLTFDGLSKGNLHTHGGYIYFNEQLPDRVTLVQVPIAGGIPKVLDASDDGLYLADISHDGGKLLVLTPDHKKQSARLRVMELASGSIHDVANAFRGDASWTPDGGSVYTGDQNVYEMDADGSHPRKLFSAPIPVDGIRVSPNGSKK